MGSVVCVSDGLPKLAVRRLLQSVMFEPHLRLICTEDKFPQLMADLAPHRLDVVLARPRRPRQPQPQGLQPRAGHVGFGLVRAARIAGANQEKTSPLID